MHHQDVTLLFHDILLNNNGTAIMPPPSFSQKCCSHLPTYSADQDKFLPTDNIEITWESVEPEGQIADFHLGVSSNKENTALPDIIDYKSTHNRTHYKCVQ